MKKIALLIAFSCSLQSVFAKGGDPTDSLQIMLKTIDSVESSFTYKKGKIDLGNNLAAINISEGFKYLDGIQSSKVIYDIWGNPRGDDKLLGMIMPEDGGVLHEDSWAFIITYEDMGYVKDKDAVI